MTNPLSVLLLCGGTSAEHEISLLSARNVFAALDQHRYQVTIVVIDQQGDWWLADSNVFSPGPGQKLPVVPVGSGVRVTIIPNQGRPYLVGVLGANDYNLAVDVVFPVLHGPKGEDGTIQGLLELAHAPYVGPDVLGAAMTMDKEVMKRLLREAGIPSARCRVLRRGMLSQPTYSELSVELGKTLFIKPASLGSSVGVFKVHTASEYEQAVPASFGYDEKLLVEECIEGHEVECAVLGNLDLKVAGVGEIAPAARYDFYSYESKYLDDHGADLQIPADLPSDIIANVQNLARKSCEVLCCEGLARVDCFVDRRGQVLVNEVNTIPGFTNISMYPKLWASAGMSNAQLVDCLLELALERFERRKN